MALSITGWEGVLENQIVLISLGLIILEIINPFRLFLAAADERKFVLMTIEKGLAGKATFSEHL